MAREGLISIDLDTKGVNALLDAIKQATGDLTPVMASIRQELLSQTEANFKAEGRPAWPALAESTKAQRAKHGKWPGQILQVSGTLARSLVAESDDATAQIGVGREVPYAAIQQFGGMAGVGRQTEIPARPYLPILDGRLTPEAEQEVTAIVERYLQEAIDKAAGK